MKLRFLTATSMAEQNIMKKIAKNESIKKKIKKMIRTHCYNGRTILYVVYEEGIQWEKNDHMVEFEIEDEEAVMKYIESVPIEGWVEIIRDVKA